MKNVARKLQLHQFAAMMLLPLALIVGPAHAQFEPGCGSLKNEYGPYDYTNPQHRINYLPIVERFHFDIGVESLKGLLGVEFSEATLGGDIEYTLRAFPNHHRALYAMMRYYLAKVPEGAPKMIYTPECWFDRATRFAKDDSTAVMLQGIYYQKIDNFELAKASYEQALAMEPDSAEIHYNSGLLYIELGDLERANLHATRAYELGHPLPGLRNKLARLGE